VESVDAETRVVIQSELVANEKLPPVARDPRVSAALESPLQPGEYYAGSMRLWLIHCA
jgi:alpha,alpha-trehalose phosphorylase